MPLRSLAEANGARARSRRPFHLARPMTGGRPTEASRPGVQPSQHSTLVGHKLPSQRVVTDLDERAGSAQPSRIPGERAFRSVAEDRGAPRCGRRLRRARSATRCMPPPDSGPSIDQTRQGEQLEQAAAETSRQGRLQEAASAAGVCRSSMVAARGTPTGTSKRGCDGRSEARTARRPRSRPPAPGRVPSAVARSPLRGRSGDGAMMSKVDGPGERVRHGRRAVLRASDSREREPLAVHEGDADHEREHRRLERVVDDEEHCRHQQHRAPSSAYGLGSRMWRQNWASRNAAEQGGTDEAGREYQPPEKSLRAERRCAALGAVGSSSRQRSTRSFPPRSRVDP